ncbi:MAG: hypothetical protein LBS93_03195 [Synergistaceae bacterium]|jgi:hypothetical protein|nr:hypothetical protein [Synergistaceae bacterium]
MNIQSVSRVGAVQNIAHQSDFVYGVNREFLPPKSPQAPKAVTLQGQGHMDTVYQYRQLEGWLGDMPVSFTYLIANRSYEYTKQVFMDWDKRTATTNVNSWIV